MGTSLLQAFQQSIHIEKTHFDCLRRTPMTKWTSLPDKSYPLTVATSGEYGKDAAQNILRVRREKLVKTSSE